MRALVLAGGASRGSFELGTLKYLIGDLKRSYDIYCGVSVGALNVSCLAMYANEQEGLSKLVNLWENITTEKVYKHWVPFRELHAIWEKSLYNSHPLQKLIKQELKLETIRQNGKQVSVGAVSLTTGKYRIFTQHDQHFVEGIIGSSAFPAFLSPITIEGELYSDGGIKEITPLKQAIDLGATEIDVIMCSPVPSYNKYSIENTTVDIALKTIELMSDEILENDIQVALLYNQLATLNATYKRFVDIKIIRPTTYLPIESLDFDHNKIMRIIQIGYDNAREQYR